MTAQRSLQRGEQIQALLAQGRQIASDATKLVSPSYRTKATRDFLLNFDHTNITFGKTVRLWLKRSADARRDPQPGHEIGKQRIPWEDQSQEPVAVSQSRIISGMCDTAPCL